MEPQLSPKLDQKRLFWFIGISFGTAWLIALILFLNGGLVNSPVLIPGTPITLALVLLAAGYMFAPALANVLTRVITKEGWRDVFIRPNLRKGKKYWLAAWVLPGILTVTGVAVFLVFYPSFLDPSFSQIRANIPASVLEKVPIALILFLVFLQSVLISPIANGIFTFGEEFGWRAYLLQKLLPLGIARAIIVSGIIWGIWHAPVIAMGHNYGLKYPGYPWSGILMMIVFCVASGTLLSWVALEGGSVWPAVIGHAAMNGIAAIGLFVIQGQPIPLLGPSPVGIIGMSGYIILAVCLLIYVKRKHRV